MSTFARLMTRTSWLAILGWGAAACGSRTPLGDDADRCFEPGLVEACSSDCGNGTRACRDGRWRDCEVPVTQRTCQNDCGAGSQTCTEGSWGACDVPVATRACSTICGTGQETCFDGKWQNCTAPPPKPPTLKATIRDFNDTHPDFERQMDSLDDLGIVESTLGADDKPVYAGHPTTPTTSGKYYFDTWYRDTPGINLTTTITIPLTPSSANRLVYDNDTFFPIDNQLFGNQGRAHNFHFTAEIAAKFRYDGGETFRFTGDDDMWVFINRNLAINLGGLHSAETSTVDLDARSHFLGIAKGGVYLMNMFFAERHTIASRFHIETTVAQWNNCE
jgi:fibro-slime domain-containing protein